MKAQGRWAETELSIKWRPRNVLFCREMLSHFEPQTHIMLHFETHKISKWLVDKERCMWVFSNVSPRLRKMHIQDTSIRPIFTDICTYGVFLYSVCTVLFVCRCISWIQCLGLFLKDDFLLYSVNSLNSSSRATCLYLSVLELWSVRLAVGFSFAFLSFWLLLKLQSPFFFRDCAFCFFSTEAFVEASHVKEWKRDAFFCVCLLEKNKTKNCWSVFDVLCSITVCLCHLCAFALLPAEMSGWSQVLVQCATYCSLRGKVHVHVCFICPVACFSL